MEHFHLELKIPISFIETITLAHLEKFCKIGALIWDMIFIAAEGILLALTLRVQSILAI